MLVKLYELPDLGGLASPATVRRAMPYERPAVSGWVSRVFDAAAPLWSTECDVAFRRVPPACFIALVDDRLAGFACYDSTCKGFLGPIGIGESSRRRGIGQALLVATLHAMRYDGYGYAVIGHVGNAAFFERTVNAVAIAGSEPGVYARPLAGEP